MTVSREQALEAVLLMTDGSEKVAGGIPQHILEHPELDFETRQILEAVAIVVPLLCSQVRMSFEKALQAEDALDKVNEFLESLEEK